MPRSATNSGNPFLTIRQSKRYSEELAALGDLKRMDEVVRGAEFNLSWDPECGQETDNPKIRGYPVGGFGLPSLVIYYSRDEEFVHFESIRLAATDEES